MFKNSQDTNGHGPTQEHTRSASTLSHRKTESVGPHGMEDEFEEVSPLAAGCLVPFPASFSRHWLHI